MADVTFLDVRRLQAEADTADVALAMDEDAFRAFYDRTAGALWGYLSRISGDRQVADDLLQESYYRLLKATVAFESEAHRRNYLYRIATNLVRDAKRGPRPLFDAGVEMADMPAPESHVDRRGARRRAARLRPSEAARACAALARVRARVLAQRNRRRPRTQDRQHQAAAVPRAPQARRDAAAIGERRDTRTSRIRTRTDRRRDRGDRRRSHRGRSGARAHRGGASLVRDRLVARPDARAPGSGARCGPPDHDRPWPCDRVRRRARAQPDRDGHRGRARTPPAGWSTSIARSRRRPPRSRPSPPSISPAAG